MKFAGVIAHRRLFLFAVLLAVALFPVGWLSERWQPAGWLTNALFSTVEAHALGHAAIFAALGAAALLAFPALQRRPWQFLAIMLALAVGQEAFQLMYKQRPIVFDDIRDLGPDLIGAVVALAGVRFWRGIGT
ncbi:MAG: hypothetical protein H7Z42_03965, partial [Roseiflexaceae bacterium]|nr:hypothetical protein [Roseiflexaceae bacterium]